MLDRRGLILAGAALGASAATTGPRHAQSQDETPTIAGPRSARGDHTTELQAGIDAAALSGDPLIVPPGRYRVRHLELKPGVRIDGVPGRSVLEFAGGKALLFGDAISNVSLFGLTLDGAKAPFESEDGALLAVTGGSGLDIRQCRFLRSAADGILLRRVAGVISDCVFENCASTSIFSHDAIALTFAHNLLVDSGDNAIQIWRAEKGADGTLVTANRIERVSARSGGNGPYGNGVAIFRAGNVVVSNNLISDCDFSAIRCNAGSNVQMLGNSCLRIGENALYTEFAFDGAIIANNLVDGASLGVSITNFGDHGGRLAIAQGNLIRNLTGDKGTGPGTGIAVEADAMVTGNIIENAPRIGIHIGWINSLRDVTAIANFVRDTGVGIGIETGDGAGRAFVTNNMISGAKNGAIRAMQGSAFVGPDLARSSAEAFPNLAVFTNVSG